MSTTVDTKTKVIRFRLERETRGAGKYNEIGEDGRTLSSFDDNACIGTLYVRKGFLGRMGYPGSCPLDITVELSIGHNAV